MNESIVANHNAIVSDDDLVYYVGDILMGLKYESAKIFDRLNGRKILIYGNHDLNKGKIRPELVNLDFEAIHEDLVVKVDGYNLYIRHIPDPAWKESHPEVDLHIIGHIHTWSSRLSSLGGQLTPDQDGKIINVGIDVSGFKPLTLGQHLARPFMQNKPHREEQ